jgi:hypothetical protein
LIERFFKIGLAEVFYIEQPEDLQFIKSVAELSFSRITKENVNRVTDFRGEGTIKTFEVYLNRGEYGIFAFLEGKVVGHVWAMYSGKNNFKASNYITLDKGESLTHFSNVNPIFRGKNIYPAMMAEISKQIFDVYKPKRILGDIEIDNIPAIKGILKSGYKHLGYVSYCTILNFKTLTKKYYI